MAQAGNIVREIRRSFESARQMYALEAAPLPSEFAQRGGAWNRTTLRLDTSLWSGPSALARLQIAEVSAPDDAMVALTVVALPRADLDAPIFGMDVVAFRGRFVLIALDLSTAAPPEAGARRVAEARDTLANAGTTRDVPAFAEGLFSPLAAVLREERSPLDEELLAAFRVYWGVFCDCLESANAQPDTLGNERRNLYFTRMQQNKRESKALGRLFGDAWAERYFREHFFAT